MAESTPARPTLLKQGTATPALDSPAPALQRTPTAAASAELPKTVDHWGKLVPLGAGAPVLLTKDAFTIGRDAANDHVLGSNSFISSVHCTVSREAGAVFLTDSSTNGTILNGARVAKATKVPLSAGSEITLVAARPGVDAVAYVLQMNTPPPAPAAPPKDTKGQESIEANLVCCICTCVIHDCVTLVPCMHSFCGGCLSEWEDHSKECPQCRGKIEQVNRNPLVNNLVEAFLVDHPDRKRPTEELKELDEKNNYTGDKMRAKQAKRPRRRRYEEEEEEEEDDDEDEEESEEEPEQCRCCAVADPLDGFRCTPGSMHERCECCTNLMPIRPLIAARPQRCGMCNGSFCSLFWACRGGACHCLSRVKDMVVAPGDIELCVNNNAFETQVLKDYLAAKSLTPSDLLRQCVDRVRSGEFTSIVAPGIRQETACCRPCIRRLLTELAYQFREKIRPDELPPAVVKRGNCWYGKGCRTQHHNHDHARKLNHICNASK